MKDSELDVPMRRPFEEVKTARLDAHKCDNTKRELVVIDKTGKWNGESDHKRGSLILATT